ncbi:hypothetical protein AAF712_002940 [Marasmius tenuissimus]|uniref:Uncharacterized protein n=1 Tax=Marasmius tenuissimus TaxID=585030 RepID=A0ABR3A8Y1_9AGAR
MDYRTFAFQEIEVSSDFRRLVQKPRAAFILVPTKAIVEKAFNLSKFNKSVKEPDERQRFEVFGSGPWEYILIPYEDAKKDDLPQLYQLSGGTTVPINYDPDNFDTLPRLTSSLHPLVALYYLTRMMLFPSRYANSIRQGVVNLFREYEMSLDLRLDCPFAPRLSSPGDEDEDGETCECSHCSRPRALDAEYIAEWVLHVLPTSQDVLDSSDIREDDGEMSSRIDEVFSRLEEENRKRLRLAKSILADRCTATRKRIRRS